MNGASYTFPEPSGSSTTGRRPSPVPRGRISLTACLTLGTGDDAEIAVQLKQMAAQLLVPGLVEVRLDLSGLRSCGAEIFGAVRDLDEQLAERGARLSITGPVAGVVIEALHTASLHDAFAFHAIVRRRPRPP